MDFSAQKILNKNIFFAIINICKRKTFDWNTQQPVDLKFWKMITIKKSSLKIGWKFGQNSQRDSFEKKLYK